MSKWQKWSIGWLSSCICLTALAENGGDDLTQYGSAQSNAYKLAMAGTVYGTGANIDNHSGATNTAFGWKSLRVTKKGWGVFSDIGVLYRGRTTISLNNTNCVLSHMDASNSCQNSDQDVSNRGIVHINGSRSTSLPVFNVGINYRF